MRAIFNYSIKPKGKDMENSRTYQDLSPTQFTDCFMCFILPQARMMWKTAEGTSIYKIFRLGPDVTLPAFQSEHLVWCTVLNPFLSQAVNWWNRHNQCFWTFFDWWKLKYICGNYSILPILQYISLCPFYLQILAVIHRPPRESLCVWPQSGTWISGRKPEERYQEKIVFVTC